MARPPAKPIGGHRKPLAIRLKEGTRVCVLLPRDGRWITGGVKKYDTKKALHTIVSDLGEAKRVDLRTVKWKLEGIEDCTDADIENALDRGKRWHKAQRAEFIEGMKCPALSPRNHGCTHGAHKDAEFSTKHKDSAAGADVPAWDSSRLRVRREGRDWYSSSDGESAGTGEHEHEDEEDFMDEVGTCDDASTAEPIPALVDISKPHGKFGGGSFQVLDQACQAQPQGHMDFQLSMPGPLTSKVEVAFPSACIQEDGAEADTQADACIMKEGEVASPGKLKEKPQKPRGRKRAALKPESPILKRPVGRPPKFRTGLAAIKYAQDIAARAINRMARDKLCNFSVIPSTIPFVEELQLIFGISRRLKVDRLKLRVGAAAGEAEGGQLHLGEASQEAVGGVEPASQLLTGCVMEEDGKHSESSRIHSDAAAALEEDASSSLGREQPGNSLEVDDVAVAVDVVQAQSSSSGCYAAVASRVSPLKSPACTGVLRDDWSRGFLSSSLVA